MGAHAQGAYKISILTHTCGWNPCQSDLCVSRNSILLSAFLFCSKILYAHETEIASELTDDSREGEIATKAAVVASCQNLTLNGAY